MNTSSFINLAMVSGLLAGMIFSFSAPIRADYTSHDFSSLPPIGTSNTSSLVMLALSNNHQLFYKAFTDWDDLDGDKQIETTYLHRIDYSGYFDSDKCYTYSVPNQYYSPVVLADSQKYCNSNGAFNQWSGNFLNWATMTRIDQIRKVLYGGYRSTDTSTQTILERSLLPNDAHSFAKYYNGRDLGRLTPFGNPAYVPVNVDKTQASGLTMCNTTIDTDSKSDNSSSIDSPPLLRAVAGNYQLWAANERWQCRYEEEEKASNSNAPSITGLYAASDNPSVDDQAREYDATVVGDYVVRVEVCDKNLTTNTQENNNTSLISCKAYPDGNYKPIGVLQEFGDDGLAQFGLMSGSYTKNKSGGVLRKNIGPITDEVNVETNGTFIGRKNGGIIDSINRFRIANYSYKGGKDSNGYDQDSGVYNDLDNCKWGESSFEEGSCTNWGNPLSEILYECYRYFSDDAKPSFDTDDSDIIPGLKTAKSWEAPLNEENNCAKLAVIAINASSVSYDGDFFDNPDNPIADLIADSSDLPLRTAKALTKIVGDGEGITGKTYFIGESGANGRDQLCSGKVVTNLGEIQGTCPDAPRLQGSYKAAGLAYQARTGDLSDLDGLQQVSTYGITLAPNLPNISINTLDGQVVTILPACRNQSVGGNCGLVDFKIVSQSETEGRFYVTWEDSEQGGDYDQDMSGIISYSMTDSQITITTDVFADSAGSNSIGFGYIVSGTTDDGFHAHSGINYYSQEKNPLDACYKSDEKITLYEHCDFNANKSGWSVSLGVGEYRVWGNYFNEDEASSIVVHEDLSVRLFEHGDFYGNETILDSSVSCFDSSIDETISSVIVSVGCVLEDEATSKTFTISGEVTSSALLEQPLYYAAKWGGFIDNDGDNTPNLKKEWDVKSNSVEGVSRQGGDGIPDSYFYAVNPAILETQLREVFQETLSNVHSGTSVGLVADTVYGASAAYQAIYLPETPAQSIDGETNTVTWGGILHALFVDTDGDLRVSAEGSQRESSGNVYLEPNDDDAVYRYDYAKKETFVHIYEPVKEGEEADEFGRGKERVGIGYPVPIFKLKNTLWNARDELAKVNNYTTQRVYSSDLSNTTRYIFTSIDGEPLDFIAQNFYSGGKGDNDYRYLDYGNNNVDREDLVNYIRGVDSEGFRSRQYDFDDDGISEPWLLGDIIHSSPHVVSSPQENYDTLYGDTSYLNFKEQYANRRHVVYVGANDGMLHAFNGGFFVKDDNKVGFEVTTQASVSQVKADPLAHPLGSELWAYIPESALPHLKWLSEVSYPHVYFVDGSIQSFDVNIFDDAEGVNVHPGGWGTILVVGMGYGGGKYEIDQKGFDETLRSSFMVFDVTDPEQVPTLIAEFSDSRLGYTTSVPTLIKNRGKDSDGNQQNEWLLVFGSGPQGDEAVSAALSDEEAKLFVYNLNTRSEFDSSNITVDFSQESHIGGITSVDWNADFRDDAIYYGTIAGSINEPDGGLERGILEYKNGIFDDIEPTMLLEPTQKLAFSATPKTYVDGNNDFWVFTGTGRFMVQDDNISDDQQYAFGVKDSRVMKDVFAGLGGSETEVDMEASLLDTTNINVYPDGTLANIMYDSNNNEVSTYAQLESFIVNDKEGWFFRLPAPPLLQGTNRAKKMRITNKSVIYDETLVFVAYEPTGLSCDALGLSYLFTPNVLTGVAKSASPFGFVEEFGENNSDPFNNVVSPLGVGEASAPAVLVGEDGKSRVITETSTGQIIITEHKVDDNNGNSSGARHSWREIPITW